MPQRNRTAYNNYQREYQLHQYHLRRAWIIKRLGGKCVVCGRKAKLHIHHRDPAKKAFPLSKGWSRRMDLIIAELKKCELRCPKHHQEKHAAPHGSYSMYKRHKCRCKLCCEAMSAYIATYRARRKASDPNWRWW